MFVYICKVRTPTYYIEQKFQHYCMNGHWTTGIYYIYIPSLYTIYNIHNIYIANTMFRYFLRQFYRIFICVTSH